MKNLTGILRAVLAVVVLAVALPASAGTGTKYFAAQFDELVPQGSNTVSVTFYNATPPPGVSTINSLQISMVSPPPGVTIVGIKMTKQNGSSVNIVPSWSPTSGQVIVVTNFPGIKNNKNATFELTLAGLPTTCTGIQWLAAANTGNAFPGGDSFEQSPTKPSLLSTGVGCDGILECPSVGPGYTFEQGNIKGYRGENKDGTVCIPVVYDLNDMRDASPPTVSFVWNILSQPGGAFEYTIPWFSEQANPDTGLPDRKTKLRWFVEDGFGGHTLTDPVVGRACLSNTLPVAYGQLGEDVSASHPTIVVTPTGASPPPVPFAISVDRERMLVTDIMSNVWSVNRGDGMTTKTAHSAVRTNGSITKVSGNPLPLDENNKQMQMCIKKESWESVDADYCTTDASKLCAILKIETTVMDIGDGFVSRDF